METRFSRAGLIIELEDVFYPHIPRKNFMDGEIWYVKTNRDTNFFICILYLFYHSGLEGERFRIHKD